MRGPCGAVEVIGLFARGASEVVELLEAGARLESDVVPGAGAVFVGVEEFLDAREVLVDAEQQVAGPSALEEHAVG